ncbi:alpha-glucosidase [Parvularcula sp. ZS-1/3]|uniref:Alpha-glucosidase n=1 Tax=Parvularcula mediterranea TaxID=2732508 RepID=A0A7Y3RNU5_9PROT|nr:alpha-glucosidase [Parvularcula mediterranea]NNU17025.1 alpha-glucosidase [Parvularcula mediterranea]
MTRRMDDPEWWRGAVIYQIYPRSFQDTKGDGVGDLRGITERLCHVADLGVDAVWLSPFFRSPMKDFGYDVSDYRDVDPMFGTMKDFDALVEEANRLDLPIIIDQVYSHTSDQHAWFAESASSRDNPKADWYVWADPKADGSPPNNWQSIFGGPSWRWSSGRQQYYLHNFLPSQPDLNLHNEELQEEILDTVKFWIERGVKGFRLDALHCSMHNRSLEDNPPRPRRCNGPVRPYDLQWHTNDHAQPEMLPFLEKFRRMTDAHGAIFSVAEVGADDSLSVMKDYTAEGRLQSAYSFDFLWSPELTAETVHEKVGAWPSSGEKQWPSWAFSNHDAVRAVSRWNLPVSEQQRAKLFALLLMSLRGNVFIYQGEELGLPQADIPFEKLQDPEAIANWPNSLGRDGARTPMPWEARAPFAGFTTSEPWLPINGRHQALAADGQRDDPGSVLNFYRELTSYRSGSDVLKLGTLTFLDEGRETVAFDRTLNGETLRAIFNLSASELAFSEAAAAEKLFTVGDVSSDGDSLIMGAFSGALLRLTE